MSRVKELEFICEGVEIDGVGGLTRVKAQNIGEGFICELEPQSIIEHQDAKELLQAIDTTYD